MGEKWRDSPVGLLFSWARWLKVKHTTNKFSNIIVPIIGFFSGIVFLWIIPSLNFAHEQGVILQCNGLLQILAPGGFEKPAGFETSSVIPFV
ncbi:MAG: hypothetical protein ABF672_10790, partial [Gluconobacter oxydans]|uniref:hypothetical protein n=1 Tax=Gluconobacter oxydans TaxID=442 RepID=UPI0039EB0901